MATSFVTNFVAFCLLGSFGGKATSSSIDMMLYCFTYTTNWGDWLKAKELLAFQIKHIVEDAGACFAFPSQSLYIETIPSERPEVYIPPENSET